jgi:glucosyl-dolichyl phosphate glucuronosyltransferase
VSLRSPVSVVIPCFTERRWPQLVCAVRSVQAQQPPPAEIVVSVDHNDALLERAGRELTGVTVLANRFARGASGNRNTAAFHTRTPLIAMLDDDSRAHSGWLSGLVAPFDDPRVVGTGGVVLPAWEGRRPFWFPDECLWVVGASFAGGPAQYGPVRNVWSLSMAVRRAVFESVGGFREGFGKVGNRSRPEDTELCVRMSEASGGHWYFVPDAVSEHQVSPQRAGFGFFLARCYSEGRGKIALSRMGNGHDRLRTERQYLSRTLPRAMHRGFADALRGRGAAHAARAGALLAGTTAAAVGGVVELTRTRRPAPELVRAGRPARELADAGRPARELADAERPEPELAEAGRPAPEPAARDDR